MEDISPFSCDQIQNAIDVVSFIKEQGGVRNIGHTVKVSDVEEKIESQLVQQLQQSLFSLCNDFVKRHKEAIATDKAMRQQCGLIKVREKKLARSGMVSKQIESASPLLIIKDCATIALEKEITKEITVESSNAEEVDGEACSKIRSLNQHRNCYICKKRFKTLHHFYDQMCETCGDKNFLKRNQTINLTGKVAIVTGARVKIGYEIALKLLRAGCEVIATTRFPNNAAARYSLEPDYKEWSDRLKLFGVDFRHTGMVEAFGRYIIHQYDIIDILINNAAQTIQRPPEYYTHLIHNEFLPSYEPQWPTVSSFASSVGNNFTNGSNTIGAISAIASQLQIGNNGNSADHSAGDRGGILLSEHQRYNKSNRSLFPVGKYDIDCQQVDERKKNSWTSKLEEVSSNELLEVLAVNAAAPFVLMRILKPRMRKSTNTTTLNQSSDSTSLSLSSPHSHNENSGDWSFIVNVSAMEGSFKRTQKTTDHPHTNGAKAFLDMITRTSAFDYSQSNIFMNSVDTGWVTNENPRAHKLNAKIPPLDDVDGAARVLDPIFTSVASSSFVFGQYFKDYEACDVGLKQHLYSTSTTP